MHGADGLGNAQFEFAELHHTHPSDKVMFDEIRAAPEEITLIVLGPLTNLARLLQRDPAIVSQIGQLIIMGGTVTASGNATPAAEFNIYFDPLAAQTVFRSRTTKTLIPLDVTGQVDFHLRFAAISSLGAIEGGQAAAADPAVRVSRPSPGAGAGGHLPARCRGPGRRRASGVVRHGGDGRRRGDARRAHDRRDGV